MSRVHFGNTAFWQYHLQLIALVLISLTTAAANEERGIKIVNSSGSRVELYWIHPTTREGSLMSEPDIMNGADFSLNSFVSHEFELREKPSPSTGVCKSEDKTCSSAFFAVSENADQVVTVHEGLEIEFLDDQVRAQLKARGIMGTCETKAKDRLQKAGTNKEMIEDAMDGLVKCVESELTISLSKASEELAFESKIRTNMASMMENYTCVDTELNSTEPVRESRWRGARDRKGRDVQVLLDRPASKIMFVKDFISQAECDAMAEAAAPKLHKASVADGKGGSKFSEHRKAMQAGIKVDWEKEHEGNHIAVLSRRVYDFTNYILNLGIAEHGQEDLMSIQYFGRGLNDTEPDRYTPHCDGDCSGLPHKTGTRMATMVMYCTIPEVGGHTNFRNSGVHLKPVKGGAVFFSYIDPETKLMDKGFTEHSGCPVLVGEKKIVTQWIRLGVDDENPWDSFNTLGIKVSEDDLSD